MLSLLSDIDSEMILLQEGRIHYNWRDAMTCDAQLSDSKSQNLHGYFNKMGCNCFFMLNITKI